MYKIAVIYSAYPEMTEAAKELIRRKGYHIEVEICVFDKAIRMAKKFEAEGFDLIISRGVTGALIQRAVNIPVILVEITNFDILQTLYKAKKIGERMAYFEYVHGNSYHDFESMAKILQINEEDLSIYYYQSEEDLREKIASAFASNVNVVVATGAFVLEMAKLHGMKSIMVHSTKEAIYNAFKQAEDILNIRNKDRRLLKYINTLLDSFETEGYIVFSRSEEAVYANNTACKLLGTERKSIVGKKIHDILPGGVKTQEDLSAGSIVKFKLGNQQEIAISKIDMYSGEKAMGFALKIGYPQEQLKIEIGQRKELRSRGLVAKHTFNDIVGRSEAICSAIRKAKSFGKTDSTILITGESGTGKEVFANSIHNISPRCLGPFVAVNCATLPQSLLESELFGYEEGAFTGAKKGGQAGLFELAHAGTIFLDEVSEISLGTQAQLLRVLQEKAIRRVGGDKIISVDVRVIAATNSDLMQRVRAGQFRADLYYRLNVLKLNIPPLRERKEDFQLLIEYFLSRHKKSGQDIKIPEMFISRLQKHSWPGNVRELENFVQKFAILSEDDKDVFGLLEDLYMEFSHLEQEMQVQGHYADTITVEIGTLKSMELQLIEQLIRRSDDDKTSLARKLGISRSNLWSKLKEIDKGTSTSKC
ncbi:MAG: sigma 54-interacting transcriptional regulator [Bacillota bacterium]